MSVVYVLPGVTMITPNPVAAGELAYVVVPLACTFTVKPTF